MSPSCPHRGPWLAALDRQWVATKGPASGSPDWAAVDDQQCVARFLPICHPIAIWLLYCGIALLTCSTSLRADLRPFIPGRPATWGSIRPCLEKAKSCRDSANFSAPEPRPNVVLVLTRVRHNRCTTQQSRFDVCGSILYTQILSPATLPHSHVRECFRVLFWAVILQDAGNSVGLTTLSSCPPNHNRRPLEVSGPPAVAHSPNPFS